MRARTEKVEKPICNFWRGIAYFFDHRRENAKLSPAQTFFFARTLQERKEKSGNSSFLMAFFCHSKKFINKILFKLSDRFSLFALVELVISAAGNH